MPWLYEQIRAKVPSARKKSADKFFTYTEHDFFVVHAKTKNFFAAALKICHVNLVWRGGGRGGGVTEKRIPFFLDYWLEIGLKHTVY